MIDSESGLYHVRARMYSAKIGRFIHRDSYKRFADRPTTGVSINGWFPLWSLQSVSPVPSAGDGYQDGGNLYAGNFVPGGLDPSGLKWRLLCFKCSNNPKVRCMLFNDDPENNSEPTWFNGVNGTNRFRVDPNDPYGPNGPLPPGTYPIVPGPSTISVVPQSHRDSETVPRIGNDHNFIGSPVPGRVNRPSGAARTGLTVHPEGSGSSLGCLGVSDAAYEGIRDAMMDAEREGREKGKGSRARAQEYQLEMEWREVECCGNNGPQVGPK